MQELTFAIFGYGGRGREFAGICRNPKLGARIVAVAEPDPERQARAMRELGLNETQVFASAAELLNAGRATKTGRLADAVINTTQDRWHAATSIPAMEQGCHVFLEKPMAVNLEDCIAIEAAQRRTGVVGAVCHSLRYNPVYTGIKDIIDSGMLGKIVAFDQIEGIGNLHFSSSFVRGPWGNEERNTFLLMSKSCHDIDVFNYLFDAECRRVSSYGALSYFCRKNAPEDAPMRCLDGCPVAETCPYHAGTVYLENEFWRGIVFSGEDDISIVQKLQDGPYGKCVFQTDNDVVDHQVVAFEYEGGLTGTFTATAFARGGRRLRLHGTEGWLEASIEENRIIYEDYLTNLRREVVVPALEGSHGGADYLVFEDFINAVRNNEPRFVRTSFQNSLKTHKVVFAAEQSRRQHASVHQTL